MNDNLTWWRTAPESVRNLEEPSMRIDSSIHRLGVDDLRRTPALRSVVARITLNPEDILAYGALADGPWGRYRLVALFLAPPGHVEPRVLCLDGPRSADAGPHRNTSEELCLYMPGDPIERRWHRGLGLVELFDIARRHIAAEHEWRSNPGDGWIIDEAPHGETPPAPRAPQLAIRPVPSRPPRNAPCPCGSGIKAKKCCFS